MDHIYDIFKILWNRINTGAKAAFLGGLIAGVITHLYVLTNKLPHTDELLIGFQGGGYYFGRWLSDDYHYMFSNITSPGLNVFLTILLLSLSAALTARILRIHSVTGGALTGVMFLTFPSVTSSMTYLYVAPVYGLCLFLITLAVWCIRRYRYGWGPAAVLILFSMAGYQAYFPYATALCLLALLADVLEGQETGRIIRKGFASLAGLAIGIAFYMWSLSALHVEVADYRGMQDMGSASIGQYVRAILRSYHRLLEYFVTNPPSYAQSSAQRWNILCVVLLAILVIVLLWRKEAHSEPLRVIMYVVFTGLTPLAIGLIYVMSVEVDNASPLMIYSYCLIYVWMIMLCEHLNSDARWKRLLMALCVLALVFVGYENHRIASDCYYRMDIANKRVYSLYTRIVERAEEAGYRYGDNMLILGKYSKEETFPLDSYQLDDEVYTDLEGITYEQNLFSEPTRQFYLRLFLGIENHYGTINNDTYVELKATDEYQEMPCWPDEDCIQKINDIWVVKMTEE